MTKIETKQNNHKLIKKVSEEISRIIIYLAETSANAIEIVRLTKSNKITEAHAKTILMLIQLDAIADKTEELKKILKETTDI